MSQAQAPQPGGGLPFNVVHFMSGMKPPSITGFIHKLHELQGAEANWRVDAPGRTLKKGMKYKLVESDRLIPFLQKVLYDFGFSYSLVASEAESDPSGIRQCLYYVVWQQESGEGAVYSIGWYSDPTHNDQSGGIKRAHRRFLKGLTGFIEQDEDGLDKELGRRAPQNVGQTYGAQHGHQAPTQTQAVQAQVNAPPPQQPPMQTASPAPMVNNAAPAPMVNMGHVGMLVDKGFDRAVAEQLVTSFNGWPAILQEKGYDATIGKPLINAASNNPFGSLPQDVEEALCVLFTSRYGSMNKTKRAWEGTGFSMDAGTNPAAIHWLVAAMRTDVNAVRDQQQNDFNNNPAGEQSFANALGVAESDLPF